MIMKNKKGMLGMIIGIILMIFVISFFCYLYFVKMPELKLICEENYKQYAVEICIDKLDQIQLCESLNATYVKTEGYIFSSNVVICYKNGEIIRV